MTRYDEAIKELTSVKENMEKPDMRGFRSMSPIIDTCLKALEIASAVEQVEEYDRLVLKMSKSQFRPCKSCNMPFSKGSNCWYCDEKSPHILEDAKKAAFDYTLEEWKSLLTKVTHE